MTSDFFDYVDGGPNEPDGPCDHCPASTDAECEECPHYENDFKGAL